MFRDVKVLKHMIRSVFLLHAGGFSCRIKEFKVKVSTRSDCLYCRSGREVGSLSTSYIVTSRRSEGPSKTNVKWEEKILFKIMHFITLFSVIPKSN